MSNDLLQLREYVERQLAYATESAQTSFRPHEENIAVAGARAYQDILDKIDSMHTDEEEG